GAGDSFIIKVGETMWNHSDIKGAWATICVICALLSTGCIAQQADLKQTERDLQQRIKQSSDESAQTRARQSQEISVLREQELPQLRGELELALHQAQELQAKQEDLKQRSAQLEQQTRRLEQLAGKLEADSATRFSQALTAFRDSLTGLSERVRQEEQAGKESAIHINETNKAVTGYLGEVNKSVASVAQKFAARLDEQDRRLDVLSKAVEQVAQD